MRARALARLRGARGHSRGATRGSTGEHGRGADPDRDFAHEIEAHLAIESDRLIEDGLSPDEARAAARRVFGNVTLTRERYRETRRLSWWDDIGRDVRYATRTLLRTPGFTCVAILTLALGIGANAAIFTVINSVLLRPLPYADRDRLVRIVEIQPPPPGYAVPPRMAAPLVRSELAPLRAQTQTLSHAVLSLPASPILSAVTTVRDSAPEFGSESARGSTPESTPESASGEAGGGGPMPAARLSGLRVSASLFPMLRARPLVGRPLDSRDEAPGAAPVVVISHAAWRRYLGGAQDVLDRRLTLDGRAHVIVGVMPPDFEFPDARNELWLPLAAAASGGETRQRLPLIARLRDDVSVAAAVAEINALVPRLRGGSDRPLSAGSRFEVLDLQELAVAPVRPALLVLAAAVGLVLLIACVNVANLLLARAAARQREIAVRVALGAGRARVIRQLVTESLVLAIAGGVAGAALGLAGVRLLPALASNVARRDLGPGMAIPRLDEIVGADVSTLAFTIAISILAGLAVGLMPALRQSRRDPMAVLREGAGAAISGFDLFRHQRLQGLLVVAEIAMATMLFVGGALLIHSFVKLSRVDPGYDPAGVLTFSVAVPQPASADTLPTAFADALAARVRALPQVRAVGYAESLPTVRIGRKALFATTMEAAAEPTEASEAADARLVSRDFLAAMGIALIAGRGFVDDDRAGRPQVLLINETLARSGVLGRNPIGARIHVGGAPTWDPRRLGLTTRPPSPWEVIGIVRDVHQDGLDLNPSPQIFVDFRQLPGPTGPGPGVYFAVRTQGGAAATAVASSIRALSAQVDAQAIVEHVAPMTQLVSHSIARPRFFAVLLGVFAGVAVMLAAVGIHGVMAYAVAQRTREIGIRMALGAERAEVMGLVLRQSLTITIAGIAVGLGGAAAVTRSLDTLLYDLAPLDPATYAAVALLFGAIATLAAYVPARRATKVDPLIALR